MSPTLRRSIRRAVALAAWLAATSASAEDGPRPPAPPREAVTACAGMAVNDACQVTVHGRTESGTCATFGDTLACRPARMPPHGPPPEAVEACSGEAAGAACAVTLDGNTLDGTCTKERGGEVACRPTDLPPPPEER
jgi:hypothetical protein